MNVFSKILNGLSFANVNNLGEFRALLRQIEQPASSTQDPARSAAAAESSAVAPEFGHAQGVL